jgi:hypothetical protein
MELDTDVDSDDLDFTSEAAGEDLALIAGAAENDEEEAADLEAAIKASLAISPSFTSKSGASSTSRGAMAALRARAAERRAGTSQVVDDRDAWHSVEEVMSSELSSDELDSDGTNRKKNNRSVAGKGKAKAVTIASTDKKGSMSLEEMKAMRRSLKEEARKLLAPVREEEHILKRRLGRKLTYVGIGDSCRSVP